MCKYIFPTCVKLIPRQNSLAILFWATIKSQIITKFTTLSVETFASGQIREIFAFREHKHSRMGLKKCFREHKLSQIFIFQSFGKNKFSRNTKEKRNFYQLFWRFCKNSPKKSFQSQSFTDSRKKFPRYSINFRKRE